MFKKVVGLFVGLTLSFSVMAHSEKPDEFVEKFTMGTWSYIKEHKDELKHDKSALVKFANEKVLPFIAVDKMARYVLGKYWRKASNEQRKRFTEAFKNMLLKNYSNTLLGLNIKEMSVNKVVAGKHNRYQVEQTVKREGAPDAKIVYRVFLDKESNTWKVYDIVAENISLLMSYKKLFYVSLHRKGIDNVIKDLEDRYTTQI